MPKSCMPKYSPIRAPGYKLTGKIAGYLQLRPRGDRHQLKKGFSSRISVHMLTSFGLIFSPVCVQADSSADIYHYEQGRQAAQRLQMTSPLSEAEIISAIKGFSDHLQGKSPAYSQADINDATANYFELLSEANRKLSEKHLRAGEDYFEQLQSDASVTITDRGWAYQVLQAGSGEIPGMHNQVSISYLGKHLNGTVFDSGEQAVWLPMSGIFPGWREALLQMPAGSRWQLVVPPELAYGETGAGNKIGPNETLIFELELHAIR